MPSLDETRRAEQSALLAAPAASVAPAFGSAGWPSLPADLAAAAADADAAWLDGGLTARVRRVARPDGDVALKKVRPQCLVRNPDGELSFVNELLRRRELQTLAQRGRGIEGLTPTLHASLAEGVIVSPWVDGRHADEWDERRLVQLFATGAALIAEGFFEWDFSPGNVLDDGRRVWLFDFGYLYRFDPLTQLNSAGTGVEHPQYHLAERFESRNLFAALLRLENAQGTDAALRLFRLEKRVALDACERLRARLAAAGAGERVVGHYDALIGRWRAALAGALEPLYLAEGWRSHETDLADDLHGQSCTPMTLQRARWLIARVQDDWPALRASGALAAAGDAGDRGRLLASLQARLQQAERWQVSAA